MRYLLTSLVHFYRLCLSPFFPPACRFQPTCSQYALDALKKYGYLGGSWRALWRILRCHPLGGQGWDPLR